MYNQKHCQNFSLLIIEFTWNLKWAVIYENKILMYGYLADPWTKSTYGED